MASTPYGFSVPRTGPQDMHSLPNSLNRSLMSVWATRVL